MIIFINGSINSGKSTVAKLLASELPNTALIEIDTLREFIGWMPLDRAISINLENTVSVIRNFVKRGLNVIAPYPISQKNYIFLMKELESLSQKIFIFTLSPKLEVVLADRGERKLSESERNRIQYHYKIGIHQPTFGIIIDNSLQTPSETVQIILDTLKKENV